MWRWAVLVTVVAGCVSTGEHEAVINERDALSAQVSELKSKVASAESEKDRLKAELDSAKARIAELDNTERQKGIDAARQAIGLAPGQALKATLETRLGDIHCELWPDIAPITVQNFVQLAEGGREWTDPRTGQTRRDLLYPGTVFHRVIPQFMIQGGDPLGTGTGGPGYEFGDEVRQDVKFDKPGLLAMANAGPGTNGSQFFVTDSTPRHLNMKHTIFGKCDLETVRKIMAEPLQGREGSTPVNPVKLDAVRITRG